MSQTSIAIKRSVRFRAPWWNPVRTEVVVEDPNGVSVERIEEMARQQGWNGKSPIEHMPTTFNWSMTFEYNSIKQKDPAEAGSSLGGNKERLE